MPNSEWDGHRDALLAMLQAASEEDLADETMECRFQLKDEGVAEFLRVRADAANLDNSDERLFELLSTPGGAFLALREALLELQRIVTEEKWPHGFISTRSQDLLSGWRENWNQDQEFAAEDLLAFAGALQVFCTDTGILRRIEHFSFILGRLHEVAGTGCSV